MTDKIKTLAEIGFNPKYDAGEKYDGGAKYASEKAGAKQERAPASAGEVEQRKANKANHSERVLGGNSGKR